MATLSGLFHPMYTGEVREYIVSTEVENEANVAVKCFVRPPEPPKFKACANCGYFPNLVDGSTVEVTAPDMQGATDSGIEIVASEVGVRDSVYKIIVHPAPEVEPMFGGFA